MIFDTHAHGKPDDRFDARSVVGWWSASQREAADAVQKLAETQAGLSRDMADAYVTSVRKLLAP
jgi:hypothetical protein